MSDFIGSVKKVVLFYIFSLLAGSIGVVIARFTNYFKYSHPTEIGLFVFLFSMIVCTYLDNEVRLDKLVRVRGR